MGQKANSPHPPLIRYLADGVQRQFTYPFPILLAEDLQVFVGDQLADPGPTVTGAGAASGGEVVFPQPPTAGAAVTLRRFQPLRRSTDFPENGAVRAKALNDEFDALTLGMQQLAAQLDRCVQAAPTAPAGIDPTLPPPAPDHVLGWNQSGDGLVNTELGLDRLRAATAAAEAAAAAARAASSDAVSAWMVAGAVHADLATLREMGRPDGPAPLVFVRGYRADFDGGEGFFHWDADSDAADDDGVVIAPTGHVSSGRWHRQVHGFVRPEWWGAYADGSNPAVTRAALQAAVDFASAGGYPEVLLAGADYAIDDTVVKTAGYSCPTIRGRHRGATRISYAFATAKPALRLIGGSGGTAGGEISQIGFHGDAQSIAIEVAGMCDLPIRDCTFGANAVGIRLHNESTGMFTENVVAHGCAFSPACALPLDYARTNGNASFHGSGLNHCLISNAAGATGPSISVGANCAVYNAPMSFTIWTYSAAAPVITVGNNGHFLVHGTIKVEAFTPPPALCTGYNRAVLAGTVLCWGTALKLGTLVLCDEFNILSNGTFRAVMKDYHDILTLGPGTTALPLGHTSSINSDLLVDIHIEGANYVYKYLLYLAQDGYGNNTVTQLANTRAYNGTGHGTPTFSFTGTTLAVTNANYPVSGVSARYSVKHMGQGQSNWARN